MSAQHDPRTVDLFAVRAAVRYLGDTGAEEVYGERIVALAKNTRPGAPDPRPQWTADSDTRWEP